MDLMARKINGEIADATRDVLEPKKQMIHVIRWNAMREMFDSVQNVILDTRKERDSIITLQREEEQAWQTLQPQ